MALMAAVLGAEHTLMLPNLPAPTSNFLTIRKKLRGKMSTKDDVRPGGIILFSLQAPLMCLAYAMILFLAGLASFVISPLAKNPRWGAEAKVRDRIESKHRRACAT